MRDQIAGYIKGVRAGTKITGAGSRGIQVHYPCSSGELADSILTLLKERVEKMRMENPHSIEDFGLDADEGYEDCLDDVLGLIGGYPRCSSIWETLNDNLGSKEVERRIGELK